MASLAEIHQDLAAETTKTYQTQAAINLYKSPQLEGLVTQAAPGRYLQIMELDTVGETSAVSVRLCEDNYPGWISVSALPHLLVASSSYQAVSLDRAAIQPRLEAVIAFARSAMACSNQYLWGGTLGPDYDCSGLVQAAFVSAGIWLPRDSYQQEAFTLTVALAALEPGDLVFFGQPRTNHVALYLGDGQYVHSSGKDNGRNGIGIDSIFNREDPVSAAYAHTLRSGGRVMQSYCPTQSMLPWR